MKNNLNEKAMISESLNKLHLVLNENMHVDKMAWWRIYRMNCSCSH